LATRLDQGGLDAVMADMRSWARRQPGTFLLGAVAAGFVVGRVVRAVKDDGTVDGSDNGDGHRALSETASFGDRLDPARGVGGGA